MSKKKNSSGQREKKEHKPLSWYHGKEPVFKFVGLFALLMGVFYACTFIPLLEKRILPSYMKLNASVSAGILSVFGEGATAKGTSVTSPRYSVDIRHGCDAVEPTALFIAAVLAFPATIRSKFPGMIAGSIILAMINLVRIVTLFYTGIYYPRAFRIMHEDVWQSLFILLSLLLWIVWAMWATSPKVYQRVNST